MEVLFHDDGAIGGIASLLMSTPDAAQWISMMYSFFALCKANEVNLNEWLESTLEMIFDPPVNRLNEIFSTKLVIEEESA